MSPVPGEPPFDTGMPNIARVYDYWLGGKDNFAADRQAADRIEKIYPGVRQMAAANRAFLGRAVPWLACRGIGQFLDLGAGLPTSENTHEAARAVNPDARVAYVDIDPVAVSHGRALLAGPGVAAVLADLRDPERVLSHRAVREIIDPGRPLAVILALTLHGMPAQQARDVVARYVRDLAPGSAVIISCAHNDSAELRERVQAALSGAAPPLHNHSRADILAFFDGLALVPPGVVPARAWRGGMPDAGVRPLGPAYVLAGVGVLV